MAPGDRIETRVDSAGRLPVCRRRRPDGFWLDDLAEGLTFRIGAYEVTAAEVKDFATRYDPQPFHLDEDAAGDTLFDGLAASGRHTAAITMRLLTSAFPIAAGVIGSAIHLEWPSPTRPGDDLRLEISVGTIAHSTSRPGRGSVTLTYDTINQHGEVWQRTTGRVIAWQRPAAESAAATGGK
ncbi:MaoC/PaaZ C-terminal domain-containing protein [Pseudonocardia sp. NPDC049154]|uniref:MaoC/PaaZ C-terminal domain-containing protein n=1 Tax=Pseudonocardia sp. NPDC049154 TaxID=3155501 RepID=UPI0033C78488